MFKALVLEKAPSFQASIRELSESDLPMGNVLLDVAYSSLNYKDGLAITNRAPVVRAWPMVAGIDGAGTVFKSSHPNWQTGDKVILNGFGAGELHWGCLAERMSLNGDWLIKQPGSFSARQAMAIGTAGYTASLCIEALEHQGVTPELGDILVTGASGGVGSVAVVLLKARGFRVVASTGRQDEIGFLRKLGADDVIHRSELVGAGKSLQKERWAGAVDVAGGHTLANICAQTRYGGSVTACGLAQSADLITSVMPFILRGVTLIGIDSVMAPRERRESAWRRLERDLDRSALEVLTTEIGLDETIDAAASLVENRRSGRTVVRIGDKG